MKSVRCTRRRARVRVARWALATFCWALAALQALMRIIYDIFCKSEIKLSAITPENFAGTRGGPFDPTSVEATALAMTVLEAVGVALISTPASRRMYGIPGCAAHRECACRPPARRAMPLT